MNLNNHSIQYIKRQAKNLKKELNISYTKALELTAKKAGFENWTHCHRMLSKQTESKPKNNPAEVTWKISFTEWLTKHKNRNSPLGDLASDMLRDKKWPSHYTSLDQFVGYFDSINAYFLATSTLKSAWKTYEAYLKRKANLSTTQPKVKKQISYQANTRKIVFTKNIKPLHFSQRKTERFDIGDKAWVSWNGSKAIPVIILDVDDRHYTFRQERPLTGNKVPRYVLLDEVGSTPEFACINMVTL